jgi:hypothetical protein
MCAGNAGFDHHAAFNSSPVQVAGLGSEILELTKAIVFTLAVSVHPVRGILE